MASNFLTKFPIKISQKKYNEINRINGNERKYEYTKCTDFTKTYGYFSIEKNGHVDFIIKLNDNNKRITYTIVIAKQHLYDSLLLFLQYRPVKRLKERTENFYTKHKISITSNNDLYNDSIQNVKQQYDIAKTELKNIIDDSPDKVRKRTAELQLNRLLEQQWKMDLLSEIHKSQKTIKEISISNIE